VIGNTVWEFPCIVPSDWEGQHRNGKNAAETVEDLQRAIAAVVAKKGVFTLVYHPHGWIKAEQVVELIDFAHRKYGRKVRFASFADAQKRIDKHLLGGWPIKSSEGGDNGVRLLDLNQDGHLDVVIGSGKRRETRIWDGGLWRVTKGGPAIVNTKGRSRQVKFVEIQDNGMASALLRRKKRNVLMHFDGKRWSEPQPADNAVVARSALFRSVQPGHDAGVRARDVNGDGYTDLVINNATDNDLLLWQTSRNRWSPASFRLPKPGLIVDDQGRDRGLRFVDLNRDQRLDLVCSNEDGYFVRLFTDAKHGWSKVTLEGKPDDPDALPLIVRNGTDNGVWFNDGAMFIQNEITGDTKDRSAKRELPVGR
jgi:hypothetical protein